MTSANSTLRRSRQGGADIDRETEEELLFLTDISRPVTQQEPVREDFDSFRLELTPTRALEPHEVRQEIYKRECRRLNVIPLSSYLRNPIRNSLAVPYCGLGPRGAMALAAPLMLDHNLVYLDIKGNDIGPFGLNHLTEACLETMSITHVNLSNNNLGSEGARILCKAVKDLTLFEYLDLSNNGFKDDDSVLFGDLIEKSKSLREVILSNNHFADRAGIEFGRAIENNDRLESFDISWNHINGRSAEAFTKGVKKNVGLKRLNISFNGFGREGSQGLALVLKKNRTLRELDLSYNRMVDEDIRVIAKGLTENDTLKTLVIGDNLLTNESSLHILKSIEDPKSLTALENVDLKNVCVDQEFVYLLEEVKEIRSINIKHGKVMKIGKPRRRRRRRKPRPKPEVENEKEELPIEPTAGDSRGLEKTKNSLRKNEANVGVTMSARGDVKDGSDVKQVPVTAPPPRGIVRESLILGQDIISKETTENMI